MRSGPQESSYLDLVDGATLDRRDAERACRAPHSAHGDDRSRVVWRHSVHDALSGIADNVVRPGSESRATWAANSRRRSIAVDDHLTLVVTGTAFFTGRFLRETPPGKDVAYVTVSSTHRF